MLERLWPGLAVRRPVAVLGRLEGSPAEGVGASGPPRGDWAGAGADEGPAPPPPLSVEDMSPYSATDLMFCGTRGQRRAARGGAG
jgi:hypothetical protein